MMVFLVYFSIQKERKLDKIERSHKVDGLRIAKNFKIVNGLNTLSLKMTSIL